MNWHPYDPARDQAAVHRMWRELHWIDADDKDHGRFLDGFISQSRALVANVEGTAECLVTSVPGSLLHLDSELPLAIVASVTTSLTARKLGLASRLTARSIAADAHEGKPLAALGMFEQGYYGRLGFGTGPYEHIIEFNPARLNLPGKSRTPRRLCIADYRDVHGALMTRWRTHGSVQVHPAEHVRAEMGWTDNPRGFGYYNEQGELTHFIWGEMKDENGPFRINALAYRDREQLLELLALLRSFGDQIYLVRLLEPAHVQLQDLIREPFKGHNVTRGGPYPESNRAEAFWQIRINDLAACLARTRLPGRPTLSFNLRLFDPIGDFLDGDSKWRGTGGDYTVHLGEECAATPGHKAALPLLTGSVAGISRLWLGCAGAHVIAGAGEIAGPRKLLDDLERTLSLPLPRPGWEF